MTDQKSLESFTDCYNGLTTYIQKLKDSRDRTWAFCYLRKMKDCYMEQLQVPKVEITKDFIKQINMVIDIAIEHGGDSGGAYYSAKEELLTEVKQLVKMLNDDRLKLTWDHEEYQNYPVITFNEVQE